MPDLEMATFRADVTPPIGHPLCAGWVKPAIGISDPLFAIGVVLIGDDGPVVLCSVDWCEISNEDHVIWREELAAAVVTSAERVAVHCGHQHDAPWPDRAAQRLIREAGGPSQLMDEKWARSAVKRIADAASASVRSMRPVSHIGLGEARVQNVASNRRIMGPDGKVKAVRFTKCTDRGLRAEPEGLIDPMLKTVSFWDGDTNLAVLHYYAVHPCSHYGEGWVTSDFVGHARNRRTSEDAGTEHIYFTGCGGNIGPGKYNDGAHRNRSVLADRVYRAMLESERTSERTQSTRLEWRTLDLRLPPDLRVSEREHHRILRDPSEDPKSRIKSAMRLAWIQRHAAGGTTLVTSLFIGDRLTLLHLPGEAFVEYQLFAQRQRPDRFVAVAAYGDCGTGYIPLAKSYDEGGYEPTDSFVSPESEMLMKDAIATVLE